MQLPWYFWTTVIIVTAIIIWKSSDQVLRSTNIIGVNYPMGIRGATFNAVSSSMPELFSTLFYLLAFKDHEGFNSGIATTAGSGIFNILAIPGLVGIVLVVSNNTGTRGYSIDKKVIRRDSLWLILAQLTVLAVLMFTNKLTYPFGLLLISIYLGYLYILSRNLKRANNIRNFSRSIKFKAWRLLLVHTLVIASSCYLLVNSCIEISNIFRISPVIMALIVTASATSIPDAFLSIIDAKNQKYDDSFSNIIGSNIFDICIVIGLPLFLYTLFYGDIDLKEKDFIIRVWLMMIGVNFVTILIYYTRKYIGIKESIFFMLMYILTLLYLTN